MNKRLFRGVSQKTINQINQTAKGLADGSAEAQREQIKRDSPFSAQINQAFAGYEEFAYLVSLGLTEAEVTRRSLIRSIDFNLYISSKRRTNYELMQQGLSPYAEDDPNSYIVLHHIGQGADAPFAELTATEHTQCGNAKILHSNIVDSWRRNPEQDKSYMTEKSAYWKKRAKNDVTICGEKAEIIPLQPQLSQKDQTRLMQNAIEQLFAECSVSDLSYISNLAQSYILAKEIGAHTVEEFILSLNSVSGSGIMCPVCGKTNISLYGSYRTDKERKQKYKCNTCGKVFSAFYNTIIQGSTLSLFGWLRFIDCLYNGYSIKKTAQLCSISEAAAFQNRLRVFYALSLLEQQVLLEGRIAIDETYVPVSYKGNRTQQKEFSMPRAVRRRGHENHTPGTSKNQACIICAIDDNGTSIAKIAGTGGSTAKKISCAIKSYIKGDTLKSLYSDKSSAIRSFAQINGFPIQQISMRKPNYKDGEGYETVRQIQRVNAYHSRLKKFLARFNGISSELLQGYVSLFSWRDRNRDNPLIDAYKELLTIMVTPNLYKSFEQLVGERAGFLQTPQDIASDVYYFSSITSKTKAEQMYALFAKGASQAEIARKFNCSRQAVHLRIKQFRELGLAYKTELDIIKENKNRVFQDYEIDKLKKYNEYRDRWLEMLEKKELWNGTQEDFLNEMQRQYGISRQTVKNNLACAKRIKNLREVFYISEQYEFLTLQEVFEAVYKRYKELNALYPRLPRDRYYSILTEEYNYRKSMIQTIVVGMESKSIDWGGKLKIKIPMAQTLNRDRAVFVDCLKWTGTKADFLKFAAQKYGISTRTVNEILLLNCMADPKRYEISKLD